jgi:large subunit ribosomal protein L32
MSMRFYRWILQFCGKTLLVLQGCLDFKPKEPTMACPKKKTSNGKRDQRRATWKRKAEVQATRALSLGKSVLTGRAKGFVYPTDESTEEA